MGQDQSLESRGSGSIQRPTDAVTYVEGTGTAVATKPEKGPVDKLLEKSAALPLPQQLLPPPEVKDDFSSALQGAQVMHDLRSAFEGLLMGIEESPSVRSRQKAPQPQGDQENTEQEATTEEAKTEDAKEDEKEEKVSQIVGGLKRRASSIDNFSLGRVDDTRAEQEKWARLGLDEEAIRAVIDECTGGQPFAAALARQKQIMDRIILTKEKSIRLRTAMNQNKEDAMKTTLALERLDRIHVSLSDVQETLESAVATANILGASHFAHDDEMCSFKNFLKHNPPRDV